MLGELTTMTNIFQVEIMSCKMSHRLEQLGDDATMRACLIDANSEHCGLRRLKIGVWLTPKFSK